MREYGVKIRDGTREVELFFYPLTYADWMTLSEGEERYSVSAVSYLASNYVTKCVIDRTMTDPLAVLDLPAPMQKQFIDTLFARSGFDSVDDFVERVRSQSHQSKTLLGAYDYFLFLYLDPGAYMSLMDADSARRAKVIALLQHQQGIDVRERFAYSIETGAMLDLTTPDSRFKRAQRKGMNANRERPARPTRGQEDAPDLDNLTRAAREGLAQEINFYRTNREAKKKPFDWGADNERFNQFMRDNPEE